MPGPETTGAVRDRLTVIFSPRRARRAIDPRLIRVTEIALVLAIAAVLSSMFWNVFGPITRPSTVPRAASAPAAAQPAARPIDPFRIASQVAAASDSDVSPGAAFAETTLNLALHGTWVDENGGAAFVQTPDGKQARFSVGDAISPGVTLERVYRDQIVINRSGVRESLRLINREATIQAPQPGAPPASAAKIRSDLDGHSGIGAIVNATPQLDEIGNVQLVLGPSDDKSAFERLGLRSGDVLVAIGNQPISGDVVKGLAMIADLEDEQNVTLSIKRDGVVMPVKIGLPDPTQDLND